MDLYGFLRITKDLQGFLRISQDSLGFPRISAVAAGNHEKHVPVTDFSPPVKEGLLWSSKGYCGFQGFLRITKDYLGFLRITKDF